MRLLFAQAWPIVRNDLRLFWRALLRDGRQSSGTVPLVVLAVLLQGTIIMGLLGAKSPPPAGALALVWAFATLLLIGGAMNQAILLLFTRSDFDLLLSSPLPSRAVLLGRLGSVATASFLSVGLFVVPLINGAIIRFSPRFAASYLVLAELSILAAAIGTGLTLVLVRVCGVALARLLAMICAGFLGASFSLVMLIPAFLPKAKLAALLKSIGELMRHPSIGFVGEASQGAPLPLLGLGLVAAGAVALAVRLLARTFVDGAQTAAGAPVRRRTERPHHWSTGLTATVLRKEFRLMARSPMLIMQLLPGLLLLAPAIAAMAKLNGAQVLPPAALFTAAFFTFLLSDVAAAGEVGWDLVRVSPESATRLRRLKMLACMAVPVLIATAAAVWIAVSGRPGLALVTLLASLTCAAGCAWIGIMTIKPSPRYDLIQVANPSLDPRQMLSLVVIFPGAIGLGLAAYGFRLLAIPFLGAAIICVIACFTLLEPRSDE